MQFNHKKIKKEIPNRCGKSVHPRKEKPSRLSSKQLRYDVIVQGRRNINWCSNTTRYGNEVVTVVKLKGQALTFQLEKL